MVRALDDGGGMCSFVHDEVSLLLTTPRSGIRALDREADPVASWRVIPWRRGWAADGTRRVGDRAGRMPLGAAVRLGSLAQAAGARWREPSHCDANCSGDPRTIWLGRSKSESDGRKRARICSVAPRLAIYLLM
jgi:hypothetical protein